MYAGGFAGEIDWRAATYVKPAKGVPIFGSGITSGTVFLENGGLADPDEKGVTLLPKALQVATTGSDILKLRVNLGTGLLNGTYVHPTDLKRRPVFGVLYQKEQEVHGQFQGINATSQGVSGTLRLTPQ